MFDSRLLKSKIDPDEWYSEPDKKDFKPNNYLRLAWATRFGDPFESLHLSEMWLRVAFASGIILAVALSVAGGLIINYGLTWLSKLSWGLGFELALTIAGPGSIFGWAVIENRKAFVNYRFFCAAVFMLSRAADMPVTGMAMLGKHELQHRLKKFIEADAERSIKHSTVEDYENASSYRDSMQVTLDIGKDFLIFPDTEVLQAYYDRVKQRLQNQPKQTEAD